MSKETINNILQRLRHIAKLLMQPVLREFNFFLVMWLINSSATIVYLVGCFNTDDHYFGIALRCLALGTFVAYILTLILHVLRRQWARITYKALCYSLMLIIEIVYVFIALNFDLTFCPRVLILLAETNSKETSEFFNTYFLSTMSKWAYAIDLTIINLVVLLEWKSELIRKFAARKIPKIIITSLVMPLGLWGTFLSHNYVKLIFCEHSKQLSQWEKGFSVSAFDHITSIYYSLCYIKVSNADIAQAISETKAVYATPVEVTEPDSLNVVVVLGESYIKSHSALYGYEHNTTPYLLAEKYMGNLIVFTDMVAPYNNTYQMQKNFFSLNDMSKGEMWYEKPIFPTIFKHAGYKVFFWDNQRNYAQKEMFTITVNAFLYNDVIASLSYDETSSGEMCYDNNLIKNFEENSKVKPGKYNLYIFHLMGQHVHPTGRYPHDVGYDVFTADSVKRKAPYLNQEKREYIASYDNATIYNDFVMKHIFDLWRDKNTVVLYFSDHGDEAYDYRNHCGRRMVKNPTPQLLHCQNDVPFMVWCSDYFISHHRDLYNQLKEASTRPGMSQDANQLLLRLAGIKTPYYQPHRDISSPQYKPQPRIVYDKYDYDKIIKK